jgi:hypothetical protein
VRGFLILGSILTVLVGWLFYAAPDTQAATPSPSFVLISTTHPERNTP